MEPIFSDLTMLETLADKISTHQPIGRALAVALDHVANNRGYLEEQMMFLNEAMESMFSQGEGEYANNLRESIVYALESADAFSKHLERVWHNWMEEQKRLEDPGL